VGLTDLAGLPDGDGVAECAGETAEELVGEAEEDGDGGGLWECAKSAAMLPAKAITAAMIANIPWVVCTHSKMA
jgi:hypothetical protein